METKKTEPVINQEELKNLDQLADAVFNKIAILFIGRRLEMGRSFLRRTMIEVQSKSYEKGRRDCLEEALDIGEKMSKYLPLGGSSKDHIYKNFDQFLAKLQQLNKQENEQ